MKNKIMLIGVGWEQLPLLYKANELGFETIATTQWKKEKINADVVYEVDSRDLNKIEQIFLQEKPNFIIADECDYSMYAVAYLTDKYNLPGPELHPLTITNNKFLQRKIVGEIDVYQPKSKLCWNFDMVKDAVNEFDYPVILKPIDNRGSIGVLIVKIEDLLKEAWFNSISNCYSRMCLVEEFIEGKHITVDGFVDSNKFLGLCVSTKEEYSVAENLDKILYFPGLIDEKKEKEAYEITNKIIESIGIKFGFIHCEFIIDDKTDKICFIEIANRGGGVHISNKILPTITSIDLPEKLIKLAMGHKVKLKWDGNYKAKVLMYFISPEGNQSPIEIMEKHKDNLLAFWMKESNQLKNIKTQGALGRAGVAILTGDNFDDLIAIGKKIENEIGLTNKEYYWGG